MLRARLMPFLVCALLLPTGSAGSSSVADPAGDQSASLVLLVSQPIPPSCSDASTDIVAFEAGSDATHVRASFGVVDPDAAAECQALDFRRSRSAHATFFRAGGNDTEPIGIILRASESGPGSYRCFDLRWADGATSDVCERVADPFLDLSGPLQGTVPTTKGDRAYDLAGLTFHAYGTTYSTVEYRVVFVRVADSTSTLVATL